MAEGIAARVLDRLALMGLAVLGVLVVLFMFSGRAEAGRLLGSVVVGLAGYVLVRGSLRLRGPWTSLGWIGVAATTGGGLSALLAIWGGYRGDTETALWRGMGGLGVLAMLVADAGALGSVTLRRWFDRGVRATALLGIGVAVCVAEVGFISGDLRLVEWLGRQVPWAYGAIGVTATVLGHAAIPVLGRMERRREARRLDAMPDRALATLQCPRCEQWLQMRSGLIACPGCALVIRFEFAEPRCGCGYPLHRLAGTCCPECGREVPVTERWGRVARNAHAPVSEPASPPSPPST